MKYKFHTIGVVAALNKYIADTYGFAVLAPPYQRMKVPEKHRRWVISILEEVDWMVLDSEPVAAPAPDTETVELYMIARRKDSPFSFDAEWSYAMNISVGRKTKTLVWSEVK